jgi:spermidine synthase
LLYQTRNFFSVVRVVEMLPNEPELHHVMLKHGTTSHGSQFYRPGLRRVPVSYFGVCTGMGILMHERPKGPIHVGIMGLGAGTLATYGREGDRFQFYEIDPDVIRITRDDGYFSYLADSRASIEIVPGDARLSLEAQLREAGPQNFDMLIMDAFSSDSVPVHLITLEAMQLYLQHLKPNGVLVVHISNVNLDLGPLVFRLAAEIGTHAVRIRNLPFPRRVQSSADWMILSRDADYFESFEPVAERVRGLLDVKSFALTLTYARDVDLSEAPLWTDDYSDLFSVLRGLPSWKLLWSEAKPPDEGDGA